MAYRNCFKNLNDDLNSGQYTSRQKARTIFKASVDLANNGGVYHKKTESGKNMGTYVGDVNISRDGKKCLIGATSYDTLLSVTNGKYLEQPVTFNIQDSEDLWSGSIYKMDLSGLVSIISYPDGSANTFSYPPNILANQAYPKLIPPSDQGLVVDPCYNVFYPTNMGADRSNHGVCYLNDERAYEQYRRPIPLTETYVKNYISSKNGFVGDYYYPMPFTFDCCNNHVASITETTGLTTFTLTDGTRQTRAATLGTLTVPSSIPINNIVSVSVGTDVTSIGDYAFYGATSLTSITIPSGVTSIGTSAFQGASSLTSVIIPTSVTSIGLNALLYSVPATLTTTTLSNFSVPTKTVGDSPFQITAPTSNSNGAFTYSSSNTAVATVAGTTITIVGSGSSTITASQAATANYTSKTITATLVVNTATLTTTTLSNFSVPTKTFGDSSFQITAPTSNSNGAFTYSSSNTAVATVSGTTITIVGSGSSIITATQAATANYTSKTITATLVVNTATPVLSNFSVPTKTFGESPFTITQPTSNISTGAFTYSSSNTAVATVSGTTITIVGSGSSIITATQAATANYTSRTITATFEVNTATPALSNFSVPTKTFGDSPFTITQPTSNNSTGAFTYTSSNTAVATVTGTTITIVGAGSSIITATQAATANYTSKTITATLVVNTATTSTFTLTDGTRQTTAATLGTLTVPSSIPISNIVSVSVGTDVTSIGDYAFYSASSLTAITIPSGVTSIGDYAFYSASSLTSVIIPTSVTSIGDTAFQYSGLTSVIFESSSNLSTLNVSIGSNPTFFGSGAVTVSTGPNNPPVMTNFNIDYTFPNIIYDVDLKTYTSDDSDLNNVSYTILPTAYCNIWYRDTLGDSWTGNTAQIKIRNSSGESIIKILGPSASDKNKWLSISIPLISESYSVILTIGGWPIECQMFIAKDSYVWNTNNGNPPIADGVNVFYSKSGFSNTTEQFTISNSNVEQPNGLTISGSNLTLNSNVFKQNSFKIKATNYGLTSNIANVTWNGPIF